MAKKAGQPKKPLDKTTNEGGAGPGDVVSASALESLRQYRAETPGAVSIEEADANAKASREGSRQERPARLRRVAPDEHPTVHAGVSPMSAVLPALDGAHHTTGGR
jgi:hypothetical protein